LFMLLDHSNLVSLHYVRRFALLVLSFALATAALSAQTSDFPRFALEVEGGAVWSSRNDVRIPPVGGTPYTLQDLTGNGPGGYFRVYANLNLARKHSLRFLAAPIRLRGTGNFTDPVFFVDRRFDSGTATEGIYEFNTYRVTYGYTFLNRGRWSLKVGGSGLVRDAKIELRQDETVARDTDLGFVPLGYFQARRDITERSYLVLDVEAAAASQGRAIDGSLKWHYELGHNLNLGLGYRTIEGGADVDKVFNFAWLHFAAISLGYSF